MSERSIRVLIPAIAVVAVALATPAAAEVHGGAGSAVNPSSVTSALVTAYAAGRHIPAGDVAGVRPGSLHTGYDASARTRWATASFFPSGRAGSAVLLGFQDGGSTGVFANRDGTGWTMIGYGCGSFRVRAGQAPRVYSPCVVPG